MTDEATNAVAKEPSIIFISYRHQEPDSSLAQKLADVLKGAGHEVFIDKGIHWGDDWVKAIRAALEKTRYLLL